MKNKKSLKIAIFFAFIIAANTSYSQSATGIGFAYGGNKPFSSDYNFSKGFQLFGNLAIADKWEIVPNIGYESLDSKGRVFGPGYNNYINSIDLLYVGVSAKYDFNRQFFAKLGPILYAAAANEDVANFGIGGTAAGGYNLDLDDHSTLELSIFTSIIDIKAVGNGITPVAGFKVAYVFNFSHGKLKPPGRRPRPF